MIVVPGGQGLIQGVSAGVGLSGGGSEGTVTLTLDLSELSAVTPANGDSLATIDSDGSTEQLTTIAALATLLAGAGLTASSSVIGADDSTASVKGIVIVAGGDGIATSYSSGTATSAVDLGTNSGLEISSNKLQIAKGISQHDTAQFTTGVVDDDFLRVAGTVVEGRSASEVLSDISAAPAAGSSNIVTTGALDAGSITSNFGAINNGASNITTTGTVAVGAITLADAANVNISTPLLAGADHTTSGITAQMLAGAAISAFNLVCIHTTTQEIVVADASAYATARAIGIAPAAISDTATGTVLLHGFVRDDTYNWTTGATLYLSETAGALTETAPTTDGAFVQAVGIALEPDVVYINPSMDVIEHA
jgi:hypothetical protein